MNTIKISSQEIDNSAPVTRRIIDTVEPDSAGNIECDVVIIGSGMGGSTFAHGIKDKGLKVVIIERGDFLPRENDNWDVNAVFADGKYRNAESWFDRDYNPFKPGVFYYVGGNTKFYGAMLPRWREEDFQDLKHRDGLSPEWPISYAELEPYYCKAEDLFKVHGNAGTDPVEPWRSQDYRWKGLKHDLALHDLVKSMQKQGLKPFSMPAAVDYGEGRPCVLCSTCDGYPCMIDAKNDAEVSALRPAMSAGSVRLLVKTRIDRLITDDSGKNVVEATGTRNGKTVRIKAKRFVLACGAVNTSALLLKSANEHHPFGLGNSSDQLGRNYMVHNSTFMIAVNPLKRNRVQFQKTIAFNDWYLKSASNEFPLGNVQMLGKIRKPMITGMKKWVPGFVAKYLTDHSVDLYITSEDLPTQENRVIYDKDKDAIKIHWTPNNLQTHKELVAKTKQVLKRAGYPLVLTERMGIATNSHMCGTAVMGADKNKSVVDVNCKIHDLENVWIVDSSTFVSSAALNPALTIAANALRVAEQF
ncbi:GMC oxidoreductase [Vibrio sp.]|uniref:GMC oxidoreductase n=1 Tax=Vibrio sp. TaxID=678 RepID=UPI003AA8126B